MSSGSGVGTGKQKVTKQQAPAKGPTQAQLEKAKQQSDLQQSIGNVAGVDPALQDTLASSLSSNARTTQIQAHTESFLNGLSDQPQYTPIPGMFISEAAMSRLTPIIRKDKVKQWQDKLTEWQKAMGKAAYYIPGELDNNTRADTATVMSYLVDTGTSDPFEMIDKMTAAAKAQDLGGPQNKYAIPVFSPTANADLEVQVQRAFLNTMGRLPTSKELNGFVSSYHELEKTQYGQKVAASQSPDQQMTVPDLPSEESQVLSGLEGTPEAMGYRARGFAQDLSDLLSRGAG